MIPQKMAIEGVQVNHLVPFTFIWTPLSIYYVFEGIVSVGCLLNTEHAETLFTCRQSCLQDYSSSTGRGTLHTKLI